MAEGGYSPEQSSLKTYKQETVEYAGGREALRITGEKSVKFDFAQSHDHPAVDVENQAIVRTASSNDYYIARSENGTTYIIDTRSTEATGKLVRTKLEPVRGTGGKRTPVPLRPVEFEKPWELVGGATTTNVKELLLKLHSVRALAPGAPKVETPTPFTKYKEILKRHLPNEAWPN